MTVRKDLQDEGQDRGDRGVAKSETLAPDKSGMEQLGKERKDYTARLKAGGKSGITDEFGKPILVADNTTGESAIRTTLKGSISESNGQRYEFVDSAGVPPFGEKLLSGTAQSNVRSESYFSATLGFEGKVDGNIVNEDVVNVNISDKMKLDRKSIFDGQPHRHVFPLTHKPGDDTHWRWIDATVRYDARHNTMQLEVHGLSPAQGHPSGDGQWDRFEWVYTLKNFREPQYAPADQYFTMFQNHLEPQVQPVWRRNCYRALKITEKARD